MSHWRIIAKLCARCGLPYEGRRGQRYCTNVCRQQAYRRRTITKKTRTP